jgi:hypothetical protein
MALLKIIIYKGSKKEIKELEVNDELTNNELEEIAKDEFLSECSYEWKIYKK